MKRTTQGATLNLQLLAALGVLLTITRDGKDTPLLEFHEDQHNLRPGDSITITVKANEQWEAAQARNAEAARLAAEQTDDVDHREAKARAEAAGAAADARAFGAEAGGPLPGADPAGQPAGTDTKADANAGQGAVTADKGATRTRSTGKGST